MAFGYQGQRRFERVDDPDQQALQQQLGGAPPAYDRSAPPAGPSGSDGPQLNTMPVGSPVPLQGGGSAPPPGASGPQRSYSMPQGNWTKDYAYAGDPSEIADIKAAGGAMAGWDQGKWDDPSHNTMKYVFGRMASNYPHTPAGLQAMMADPRFAKAFPNAKLIDSDEIDFGDGHPVDVIVGAEGPEGGKSWAWQTSNPADAQGGGGPQTAPAPGGQSDLMSMLLGGGGAGQSDMLQQIMAALGQVGGQQDLDQNVLQQVLR